LAGVVIERLPYADCIARYDRPETLFFLDPPYMGSEHYYGRGLFGPEDYARLAEILRGLKGRFLMTLNDCPGARKIFALFALKPVKLTYSVHGRGRRKDAGELLISPKV